MYRTFPPARPDKRRAQQQQQQQQQQGEQAQEDGGRPADRSVRVGAALALALGVAVLLFVAVLHSSRAPGTASSIVSTDAGLAVAGKTGGRAGARVSSLSMTTRTTDAEEDRIEEMPFYDEAEEGVLEFEQFTGYLHPTDAKHMFYWFVTSQSDTPEDDPIVFWTNGGPGCSSMMGFFEEHGPFRPASANAVVQNEYAWNKVANVFYVETPIGCGYSYSTDEDDYAADDESTWTLNYDTIVKFFERYPEYSDNDFYISAESYGGHYIPQLAKYIVDNDDGTQPFNFKGFFLGNPYTSGTENLRGMFGAFGGRDMTRYSVFEKWMTECNSDVEDDYYESPCIDYEYAMLYDSGPEFDWYALDYSSSCVHNVTDDMDDVLAPDDNTAYDDDLLSSSDSASESVDRDPTAATSSATTATTTTTTMTPAAAWNGKYTGDDKIPSWYLTEARVQARHNLRRFFQKAEKSNAAVASKFQHLAVYKEVFDAEVMVRAVEGRRGKTLEKSHKRTEEQASDLRRRLTFLPQSVFDSCMEQYVKKLMNQDEMVEALGVDSSITWKECSTAVNYDYSDEENPMMPYYTYLLESGADLRMLVYSGDDDSVCGTQGTEYWMDAMDWTVKSKWNEWFYWSWDAGYHVEYENGLRFVTVHTAGHEVPKYQPGASLKLFTHFLNGEI